MWVSEDTEEIGGHPELTGWGGTVRGCFANILDLERSAFRDSYQVEDGSLGPWTTYLEVVSKRWDWKGLEPIVKFKDSLSGIGWRGCSNRSHSFILFPFQ